MEICLLCGEVLKEQRIFILGQYFVINESMAAPIRNFRTTYVQNSDSSTAKRLIKIF